MKNSCRFFENRECEYFPCHSVAEELNCLFCYCPLYLKENCPGTPRYLKNDKGKVKDCSACTFPHKAENYDKIIELLKQ